MRFALKGGEKMARTYAVVGQQDFSLPPDLGNFVPLHLGFHAVHAQQSFCHQQCESKSISPY